MYMVYFAFIFIFLLAFMLLNLGAIAFALKEKGLWGVFRMLIAIVVHTIFKPLSSK